MKKLYTNTTVQEFGIEKQYLFFINDAIGQTIHREGHWESHLTELLTGLLKNGDNCLDIGANFGYHTITMAKLVGESGKVFAFEPMRLFHQQVGANACLNDLSNITVLNNAVGDSEESVFIPEPNLSSSTVNHGDTSIDNRSNGQQVKLIAIDSLELPKIKFLKLDVQGCELRALKGAKQLILRDKPCFIVEIESWQLKKFNCSPEDLIQFIKTELNYDIYQMMTKYPADFLCVPKDSKVNLNFKTFELKKV